MCKIKDILDIIEQEVMPSIKFEKQEVNNSDSDYSTSDRFIVLGKPEEHKGILYVKNVGAKNKLMKFDIIKKNEYSGQVTSFEINLIRRLLDNLWPCLDDDKTSLKNLSPYYIQLAICDFINAEKEDVEHSGSYVNNNKELNLLLNNLDIWSQRTYEGERVEMVFVIPKSTFNDCQDNAVNENDLIDINDVIKDDFMAPIANIGHSAILLDRDCNICKHISLEAGSGRLKNCTVPYKMNGFINFLNQSEELKQSLVIALIDNGDILLIRDGILQFARRRGQWHVFNDTVLEYLMNNDKMNNDKLSEVLYNALLDVSFAHTGGCIGVWDMDKNHLSSDDLQHLAKMVDINDIYDLDVKAQVKSYCEVHNITINEDKNPRKRSALKRIIGSEMNISSPSFARKKFQELLGIDGAMLLDQNGNIIAVGAIVQIEGGSATGGRLAATQSLAKYGIAIKVSEDGKITGFCRKKPKEEVFNLG